MDKTLVSLSKMILILILIVLGSFKAYGEESESILQQIKILQQDIKTLERAVYAQNNEGISGSVKLSDNDGDVLTRHLLKLSDLEEQFKIITNSFEEVNFKLDKLSNRITKIQTDNQTRFIELEADIEKGGSDVRESAAANLTNELPGSSKAKNLGSIADKDLASLEQNQKTQSIESAGTVIIETAEKTKKLLPEGSPDEQYKFAQSFLKVGDYETAEFALREFIDSHPEHELAGSALYWYGETFRVRQLYQDAASAYLDGYQKYPKSAKAPINLLKLGVMMVQIGEKDQGCSMISGIKTQYPEANQSVIQKAEYEKKKFNCDKKG
jgi:tol-pal system protein YbgF